MALSLLLLVVIPAAVADGREGQASIELVSTRTSDLQTSTVSIEVRGTEWYVIYDGRSHLHAPKARVTLESDGEVLFLHEEEMPLDRIIRVVIPIGPFPPQTAVLRFVAEVPGRFGLRHTFDLTFLPTPIIEQRFTFGSSVYAPDIVTELPLSGPSPSSGGSTSTTVTGTLYFRDPNGGLTRCSYCKVDIRDEAGVVDRWLAETWTAYDGSFSSTVSNVDESGGIDVYLSVYPYSSKGRVYDNLGIGYEIFSGVVRWNCPNGTCSLGDVNLETAGSPRGALWIYKSVAVSWLEVNSWTTYDPGQVKVRYPNTDPNVAYFTSCGTSNQELSFGANRIHQDDVAHEYGHFLMCRGYSSWMPSGSCGSDGWSPTEAETNLTCAWREGWAEYYALEVWNDPIGEWGSGSWINYETWICEGVGCGGGVGDGVPGRITSTFWDLVDPVNDGFDANVDYGFHDIWLVLRWQGGRDWKLRDYWDNWQAAGYSPANFDGAAQQNTIDYWPL